MKNQNKFTYKKFQPKKSNAIREVVEISLTVITLVTIASTILFYRAPQEFSPKAQASESKEYDILSGTIGEIDINRLIPVKKPATPAVATINRVVREITAYNVGDVWQTDDTPCIGADGGDLCEALATGQKVCAANFVKLGTTLHIDGYDDCIVRDRMNSRYKNRVDIAMPLTNKTEALQWGTKRLGVTIK